MDERRSTKRQRVLKAGSIQIDGGDAIDCTARNASRNEWKCGAAWTWNETARERYHFMDNEDFPSPRLPTDQATPPEAASNSRWRNPFWIGGLVRLHIARSAVPIGLTAGSARG